MNRLVTLGLAVVATLVLVTSCGGGGASGPGPKGVADLGKMPSGMGWACMSIGAGSVPCLRPAECEQLRAQMVADGHDAPACEKLAGKPWCYTQTADGGAGYACTPDRDACQADAATSARAGNGATNCAEWP